jgi:hypothetical protein
MHTGWISRDDGRRFPLDPLQRRAELIEHYDRHGYPERAAYLRRIDEGPRILASPQAAATDPCSLLDVTFVAIEWWAGDGAGRFAITDFMVSGDDVVDLGFRLERALLLGLAARVNTRLQPFPRQLRRSPDYEVYHLVRASHEAINGSGPLPKWELSPPHRDGISAAHVMVCDLCSVVELTVMPARRCRLCARRHALPAAMLAPITNPNLPWLITGYRQQHLHTCEVCGTAFFGNVDAKTCSARCRTARHRAAE